MSEILANRVASFAAMLALTVCLAGPASARVGVISVTAGGSSVQQGTDLQIGQRITTGTDGRVHLMFVDGSAVTVGPNSVVAIENYAYDAGSKKGALALHVEQGTVRFVGGAISKTADARIRTPSSTIGIRGGIAAVTVSNGGATTANFLHGSAMRVSGQGITQTATRSGSQISVTPGGQPSRPAVLVAGQLASIQLLDREAGPGTNRATTSAVDRALANSDLHKHNSAPPVAPTPLAATGAPLTSMQRVTEQVQASQLRQQANPLPVSPPPTIQAALPTPIPPIAAPVSPSQPGGPTAAPAGPGVPRGAGTLTKTGGTLTLMGTSTMTGGTTIGGGALIITGTK